MNCHRPQTDYSNHAQSVDGCDLLQTFKETTQHQDGAGEVGRGF